MVLMGCKPEGRFTEQHDIHFGVAAEISDLKQNLIECWPEAKGKIHIDAWRCVTNVDGFAISIHRSPQLERALKLYFINLGGYKPDYFGEPHYMMLTVAEDKTSAIKNAKSTDFYRNMGFEGAPSHVDDKYGVDVDDIYDLEEILSPEVRAQFHIHIQPSGVLANDKLHLGYLPLSKLL